MSWKLSSVKFQPLWQFEQAALVLNSKNPRFASSEINHWIETQIPDYSDQQLTALEQGDSSDAEQETLISRLLSEAAIAVPLAASTRTSVLKELVKLAEQSWQVYDPQALLEAVRLREEKVSTALPLGVARLVEVGRALASDPHLLPAGIHQSGALGMQGHQRGLIGRGRQRCGGGLRVCSRNGCRAGAGDRREFIRDNLRWREQQQLSGWLWHGL